MITLSAESLISLSFRISDLFSRLANLPESFYQPLPQPFFKSEFRNPQSEIHLTTSYALTFRESSARQMAQITKSAAHEHHNGGSFMTISRTTWPSMSVMRPVVRTNVPNNPAETFFVNAPRLMRLPQRVIKIWLITSPNIDGINNSPSSAALATTRHLTRADTAWESSASNRIQTKLERKIALAIQILLTNQLAPSRYDWKRKRSNCGIQVIAESRINRTDIFPSTYSVRENGRQR